MRFLLVFIFISATLGAIHVQAKTDIVTCYLESGSLSDDPGKGHYKVGYIETGYCTHIIYGFAKLGTDSNKIEPNSPWIDLEWVKGKGGGIGQGSYNKITKLKDEKPGLKILLAIGGMMADSERVKYSNLVASEKLMDTFIAHVTGFLTDNKFDGLDLDWEYPNQDKKHPKDKPNFVTWVRKLRTAFDDHNRKNDNQLMLTAAVMSQAVHAEQGYDIKSICKEVDLLQLMAYDYYGGWAGQGNVYHHSALRSTQEYNTEKAVNLWINEGCAKEKIVMGIPLYGLSYTLSSKTSHGIGAKYSAGGEPGPIVKKENLLSYLEICIRINTNKWTKVDGTADIGPYAYGMDPASGTYQWVGFDDANMVQNKAKYAKDKGLAGVMVWSIDYEDHANTCGGGKYPLLKAINDELFKDCVFPFTYDGVEYEECAPGTSLSHPWCPTLLVQSDGKEYDSWKYCSVSDCVFPFVYNGVIYRDTCAPATLHDHPWCPTTLDQSDGTNYDSVIVCPDCVFPFTYYGVSYEKCAPGIKQSRPWCPTTLDQSDGEEYDSWKFCSERPQDTSDLTNEVSDCVFPFTFLGVLYEECAPGISQNHPWCPTALDQPDGIYYKFWKVCTDIEKHKYYWPMGSYGLPKTKSGCPGGLWLNGERYHDTENDRNENEFSSNNHISGTKNSNGIAQHFCMKTNSDEGGISWPDGQYCVFQYGDACPSGMRPGFIRWDDEDDSNDNWKAGFIPKGKYDRNTLIWYCCISNSYYKTPITLPTHSPFILFQYSNSKDGCQRVSGMRYKQEYIYWDLEDEGTSITDSSPSSPYKEIDDNLRLYYCYYYKI